MIGARVRRPRPTRARRALIKDGRPTPQPQPDDNHEGREIELLARGEKPLAVISLPITADDDVHDPWLDPLRPMLATGQLLIEESTQIWPDGPCDTVAGSIIGVRQLILCRADQAWRIPAWRMLEASGDRVGWDEAHERMASFLLGYGADAIDRHVVAYRQRFAAWASITVCWAIRRRHFAELEALAGRAVPTAADTELPLVIEPDRRLRAAARRLSDRYGDVVPIRFALETRFTMALERAPALGRFQTCTLGSRTTADLNAHLRSPIEVVDRWHRTVVAKNASAPSDREPSLECTDHVAPGSDLPLVSGSRNLASRG